MHASLRRTLDSPSALKMRPSVSPWVAVLRPCSRYPVVRIACIALPFRLRRSASPRALCVIAMRAYRAATLAGVALTERMRASFPRSRVHPCGCNRLGTRTRAPHQGPMRALGNARGLDLRVTSDPLGAPVALRQDHMRLNHARAFTAPGRRAGERMRCDPVGGPSNCTPNSALHKVIPQANICT